MKYLAILLIAILISASVPPMQPVDHPKTEQINDGVQLGSGLNSVDLIPTNNKKYEYCGSVKVPYIGVKLKSCASVEVGKVFIKFCGSVIGLNKCYTLGYNPSSKCHKLITAYFGYMEVCPYNLKVTSSSISTTVKFNLCGKIPWFSAKCTTFWSKTIKETF